MHPESPSTTPPQAGRELDALIAEKVMGWTDIRAQGHRSGVGDEKPVALRGRRPDWVNQGNPFRNVLPYSTDISAAWEVVEKMRPSMMSSEVSTVGGFDGASWWRATFDTGSRSFSAEMSTAPLAICLAALKAVEATNV